MKFSRCRVLLPLFFLLVAQPWLRGEDQWATGREIYKQQCASCHGPKGEGVRGKYSQALQGDWPVAKLARIISKTMPDDDPEQCVGEEAEEVARYIHHTFYSREARARQQSARVELSRLTNRQFLHTTADLIKQFTRTDPAIGGERGLNASYFDGRRIGRDKKMDRVDGRILFDFGEGSPDEQIGTEEFAIQWRGSVIAPETGLYEFIIRTPNGARLWVNQEDQTLIDGWVSTGEPTEHRAALRLIGGRAYPIRLDYFKFKEKTASIALEWTPPHGVQEPIPARNLIPQRMSPTMVLATPFPPDDSSVGYERGVAISKSWHDATTHAAIEVANYVVRRLDALSQTKPDDPDRRQKVEEFCAQFVETAFRRPLTEEQKRMFVTAHIESADQVEDAVRRIVLLALKSPRFLYLGLANSNPDDFEVAARLSFGLWDSLPDPELLRQAAQGKLRTRDQVTAQARRMLGDDRTRAKLRETMQHWLEMNHVEDFSKDRELFPGFDAEIIAALRTSLELFVEETVWSEDSNFRDLLLADYLYLNPSLAEFYGVETNGTEEFVKVRFDPAERAGVVTHPYLLAAFSYPRTSSPIHRGVFLARKIAGRALNPPPIAVEFDETEFSPDLTMREKIEELTSPASCKSCHAVINPLGFTLEYYDAVGRFRTVENERRIDAAADYLTPEGEKIRLTGPRSLAEFAVADDRAQKNFIEHLFHKVVKQPVLAYGPDALARLRQSFAESEYNVRELLVEIAATAALHGTENSTNQ